METMESFVERNQITANVVETDKNPNMMDKDWEARHYKVVLRRNGKQMTVVFSVGMGWETEPNERDVLNCLALDVAGYENAKNFEEWCDEYGYDTDSRKAEKAYNVIGKQKAKLVNFLGTVLYNELLWGTEVE